MKKGGEQTEGDDDEDDMIVRFTFENNAVYANTSNMKMKAVVAGLKPRHFDVVCKASRWRIVKDETKEYIEIDSRNIVIQQEQGNVSNKVSVSISDLELVSRHKPRDWDCTLRGRVVSLGSRRLAKSASNSFILELTDESLMSSVRVVFQGTCFMRYYSCLRYGDVVVISHLRRKQIRFRGENEFDFRIMAATPKKTCIHIIKSDEMMMSSTAKLSDRKEISSQRTVTLTGWIGEIQGNGQFSIHSEPPRKSRTQFYTSQDPEMRVYITGSTAVPFEGLGFRQGTKVRLCHVHPIYDTEDVNRLVLGFVFCEKSSIQLLELSETISTTTWSPVILPPQWRHITRMLPLLVIPWALTHMFPTLEAKFGRTKIWKKHFVRSISTRQMTPDHSKQLLKTQVQHLATMLGIRVRNVDRRRVFLDHEGSQCKGSTHWFDKTCHEKITMMTCSPCSYDDEDETEMCFPSNQLPRILTVRELLNACAHLIQQHTSHDEVQSMDHNALKKQLGASWLLILGHVQIMSSSSYPCLSLCDRTGAIRVVIPNMASPTCLKDHVITAFSEFNILAQRFGGKTRYSLIVSRCSPSCLFSFTSTSKEDDDDDDDDGIYYSVIRRIANGFSVVLNATTSIVRLYVKSSAGLTMQPGEMYYSKRVRKVKENTYRLDEKNMPCLVRFAASNIDFLHCPHKVKLREDLETQHIFATRLGRTYCIADALQQQEIEEEYPIRGVLVSRTILRTSRMILLRLCDERCPQLFSHHQSIVSSELMSRFTMTLGISFDHNVLPVASGVIGMSLEISGGLIFDTKYKCYRLSKNACIHVVDSKFFSSSLLPSLRDENASWAANVLSVIRTPLSFSSTRLRTLSQLYQMPLSRTNRMNPVRVKLSVLNIECLDVAWPCVLCGCANLNFQCKHPETDCLNVPWRSCRCQPKGMPSGNEGGVGFKANYSLSRCRW